MTADHLTDDEFERLDQLQILEHEQNNRNALPIPYEAMRTRLNKANGRLKLRRDKDGFEYTAATPHLRVKLSVRFDDPVHKKPAGFSLHLRRPTRRGAHHRMHKDRHGFDIVFGSALIVRREFQTGISVPVEAVLTLRFARRLRAMPRQAHLRITPRLP
jgi:hypothetical protein